MQDRGWGDDGDAGRNQQSAAMIGPKEKRRRLMVDGYCDGGSDGNNSDRDARDDVGDDGVAKYNLMI